MIPALRRLSGRVDHRLGVLAHHVNCRRAQLSVGALVPKHVRHGDALRRVLGVQQVVVSVITEGVVVAYR